MAGKIHFYKHNPNYWRSTKRGIPVLELKFLSPEESEAKITLKQPDAREWDLVGVFSKFSLAVSRFIAEQEDHPGIRLLIQPYRDGEAGLFRKRV